LFVTVPGSGTVSMISRVVPLSDQASTDAAAPDFSAAWRSASLGILIPGFCGETARMTRLSSFKSDLMRAEASLVVIVGRSCLTSSYS
jgi:hypothetical protein